MTPEIKRLTKKLETAERRYAKARLEKSAAERQLRTTIINAEGKRPDLKTMSAKELGEMVADAARSHGAACVDFGDVHTSDAWSLFRIRLAALVKRAS